MNTLVGSLSIQKKPSAAAGVAGLHGKFWLYLAEGHMVGTHAFADVGCTQTSSGAALEKVDSSSSHSGEIF